MNLVYKHTFYVSIVKVLLYLALSYNFMHVNITVSYFKILKLGQRDGSAGKEGLLPPSLTTCVHSQIPHGGRRELTSTSCSLTSTLAVVLYKHTIKK